MRSSISRFSLILAFILAVTVEAERPALQAPLGLVTEPEGRQQHTGPYLEPGGSHEWRPRTGPFVGAPFALGALQVLASDPSLEPEERARRALAAAESHCAAVRSPFHFVTAEAEDEGPTRQLAGS